MLPTVVKRNGLIVMDSTSRDVSSALQGNTDYLMPDHERSCRSQLLGERQELRREINTGIAVECHLVSDPEAVEDGQ